MRNLSAATRQKLAILLKSKAKATGSGMANTTGPNMAPPPIVNAPLKLPMPTPVASPVNQSAEHMSQPGKFGLLKKKMR